MALPVLHEPTGLVAVVWVIPPSGRTCPSWAAFPLLPCSFPKGWSRPGRLPSCPTQQTAQAPSTLVQKALSFLMWFFFFFPALVRYKWHGGSLFTNLYPTLCNPMDYSLPGSSIHGTLQARILEWLAITGEDPSPGDLPDPGIKPASLQAHSLPTEPPGSSVIDIFHILKSFLVGTPKFYSLSKFQLCDTVLSASPHHTLDPQTLFLWQLTAWTLSPTSPCFLQHHPQALTTTILLTGSRSSTLFLGGTVITPSSP